MAAKENITMTTDITVAAREIDFVTRFQRNWDHLRTILGIMRPIRMQPGTVLKSKYAQGTLQSGTVGEGEEIPFSKYTVKEKEYGKITIPCGVYGYFKAANREQADKELAYFKKLLTVRSFELPVAVDIEDEAQKPLGKAALTDLTAYMLSTVESWGVYALLYTGLWFGNTFLYMGGAALKPYDVWLAAYRTKKPAPSWPFGMWQYTSKARVPGVTTNVDMSHAYKDYAGIISKKGLTRPREGK